MGCEAVLKKNLTLKKLAISTGGGDAPGLNAVIRAVVVGALRQGIQCVGIRDGFDGLLNPRRYPNGSGLVPLSRNSVRGITHLGGTILGTTNKGNPLRYPVSTATGIKEVDRTEELVSLFRQEQIDVLITVGGDGTMKIAQALCEKGMNVIGVPKTIDNDLEGTVVTFGFDTAVAFATECVDRVHSTAQAHQRIMVIEVMGRYAGWIALEAGVAGTADVILIPEIPYDLNKIAEKVEERYQEGHGFCIIVVAEGARPLGGDYEVIESAQGREKRLGGIGAKLSREIEKLTGRESRHIVLGHLQRGGKPTAYDRLIALRFGAAAVRAAIEGRFGVMVALDPPEVKYIPIKEATKRTKTVPLHGDTIRTARDLGICFGD